MYDLIIKNGLIIDGTGSPGFHGDVAISNGKIAKVARNISGDTSEIIDARGLVVTPGFIDSHSHSDNALFDYPQMTEKIEQGITTSVGGQCGNSLAPKLNGQNFTFGDFSKSAKDINLGSNLMTFVGHRALRESVIGFGDQKATTQELEKMKELLRDAMENGAVGLSYGLIYTPSCYADTEELIELAKVVKEYEGLLSAHIRDESFELVAAVEEFLTIIKAADVKAVFSHHKAAYRENWGKVNHTLKMIQDAVDEGYDIYCDVYPYIASHTSLSSTIIDKKLRALDSDGIVKLVSDSVMREKIKELYVKRYGEDMSDTMVAFCNGMPEYEGLRINEIAKMRGQAEFDAALDLIRDSGSNVGVCKFTMCEEDVITVMKYERAMICTDSSVAKDKAVYHPRLRGTFPRAFGRYVRELGVTTLWEMVRKCTAMPASVYGLPSKGLLKSGFDADICVFDANSIMDNADFTDCSKRCQGLNYVVLGGEIVVKDAVFNGKTNGKFIYAER